VARSGQGDSVGIRAMFDRIAHRYDLLNHLLSANLDRGWRRAAARRVAECKPRAVLDLCGGTGDLTLAIARAAPDSTVVCCDFSRSMLRRAQRKFDGERLSPRCLTLEADGLRLPFPDGTFDVVSVGFGVRNLRPMAGGLAEIHRVLASDGRLVVLEFSRPTAPLVAGAYAIYLRRILPRLGDPLSGGGGAYGYLARTIGEFPDPSTVAARIGEAGFTRCTWETLCGGIVAIHIGEKSRSATGAA